MWARPLRPSTLRLRCGGQTRNGCPSVTFLRLGFSASLPTWRASFVDGAGGHSVFPRMWQRMQGVGDGSIVVSLEETKQAMRLLAEKARVIAEGAGALPVAAALTGKVGNGPIVAVVSGGNIT